MSRVSDSDTTPASAPKPKQAFDPRLIGPGHRFADPHYCACPDCHALLPKPKERTMISGRYRKKPVEIDAHEWDGDWPALMAWLVSLGYEGEDSDGSDGGPPMWTNDDGSLIIETLESSEFIAPVGWVIIRGVKGEFYACEREIFEATYDAA